MEKLHLLKEILGCLNSSRNYQNLLKETLLKIQEKLRYIALCKKKTIARKNSPKKKSQNKRLPYHPCFQLSTLIKNKMKRKSLENFCAFPEKTLKMLQNLTNLYPNQWDLIASELNKSPLACFRNYIRRVTGFESEKTQWTENEDLELCKAVERYGKKNWGEIANCLESKTSSQCYHRYMKTLNPGIKRGKWDLSEDIKLILSVQIYGMNWINTSEVLQNRTDIQCRERYCNVLCPSINSKSWQEKEDTKLILAILAFGKKWSKIAKIVCGRTDNQCWRRSKILMKSSDLLRGFVVYRTFRSDKRVSQFLSKFNLLIFY